VTTYQLQTVSIFSKALVNKVRVLTILIISICFSTNVYSNHPPDTPRDLFEFFILGDFYSYPVAESFCISYTADHLRGAFIGCTEGTNFVRCNDSGFGGARCKISFYCRHEDGTFNVDSPALKGNGYCPGAVATGKNVGRTSTSCPVLKGNPINIGTGNKFQIELDYTSPIKGGLQYRRYYNSFGRGLKTRYSLGWSADYWQRISQTINPNFATVTRPDGRILQFEFRDNSWIKDPDVVEKLEEITDGKGNRTGWLLTTADDTVEEYAIDGVGRPIKITDRNGFATTLEYNLSVAEGFDGLSNSLDRVTDPFGRTLTFHYDTEFHLIYVIDPDGNKINYSRDANGNLISVTYPDETPADSNDNPKRLYHYEDTNFLNYLTGITDETSARFATWGYDAQGRAIFSEHAGGVERIDITYNSDGSVTVTDSRGLIQIYNFEIQHGVAKIAQVSGGPCPNCGQIQNMTYDANGFVASRTDFNDNVTTFVNDSRGLQTSRTEAVGTPEERTITTEWHPTFRLPIRITEPGKITTFTYDAQGRLLERKVEAVP